MKRRARTVILVAVACLAAALLALFVWLPWNPLEADAGPLDSWVPRDADAVVRFDAGTLRRSGRAQTLWEGPAGARLRSDHGLDEALDGVHEIDGALAAIPGVGGDPPTVAGDFLGRETLIALRGDDVLVLARISGRAKAIDLLRRASDAQRRKWGIRIDGDAYALTGGDGSIGFARRRDVLLVATSRQWLASALALAEGRGTSIAGRADYAAAPPPVPAGSQVTVAMPESSNVNV